MSSLQFLLGEITSPFPAQILKKELDEQGIIYRSENNNYTHSSYNKEIIYVSHNDSKKAIEILKKVEKEDAESSEKFEHWFIKMLKKVGPFLIIAWVLWKLYSLFNGNA